MSDISDQEDKDLAEVTRVVDEIARQIRQEQDPETGEASEDVMTLQGAVVAATETASDQDSETEPDTLFNETDFQQFLDDVAPPSAPEEGAIAAEEVATEIDMPNSPEAEDTAPAIKAQDFDAQDTDAQSSGIGALFSLFKPAVKDGKEKDIADTGFSGAPESALESEAAETAEIAMDAFVATEPISLNSEKSTESQDVDYRTIAHTDIDYDVRDVLDLPLSRQSPLQCFANFAEELPLQFPINQFRIAVHGGAEDFADALAETRSSAANINILLRYAEALQAEQNEDYTGSVQILDELGRPALDNPSVRYDLARIAERAGDINKSREEYQTLIGISDDVKLQQLALARLIDLAHQSKDIQAVPSLLRQLCARLEPTEQQDVLLRFYSLAEQVRDPDNRCWLLERLLELVAFDDDPHLLAQSVVLAQQRGAEDDLLAC